MPDVPVSTALTEDSSIAGFKTKQNSKKKKKIQNNQTLTKKGQRMEYTMDS